MEADENFTDIEANQATYVVFPDAGGSWRIQAVPVNSQTFESRKALPESWRGLQGAELFKVSGIDGVIFIHGSGFIGGLSHFSFNNQPNLTSDLAIFYAASKTKESALEMAQAALSM